MHNFLIIFCWNAGAFKNKKNEKSVYNSWLILMGWNKPIEFIHY